MAAGRGRNPIELVGERLTTFRGRRTARLSRSNTDPMDAETARIAAPQPLTHRESRLIVFGVLVPTFLGSLDNTVLATALPTIGREFHDVNNLSWLITAYLVSATAMIPLYGKLADIHGRVFALRVALSCYLAGSLVCGLAPSMLVFILGRVVHGIGGGGLTSIGMIVLGDVAAPKDRGRYYAYFSVVYTSAGALGPVLGGFMAQYLHWSYIFFCINLPCGCAAMVLTFTLLRRLPRYERPHRLDVIGAVLMVTATVAFMLALNQGGVRFAWTSTPILSLIALALVFGGLFVWRLLRAVEPLIPLTILSNWESRVTIATNAFGWGSIIGLNIFLPIYLQSAAGMTATQSGLSLMVVMLTLNISAGISGQLLGRVKHYKTVPLIGLAVAIVAVLLLAWQADRMTIIKFELLVGLYGLGFGPLPPLCTTVLQNSVPLHQFGTGIGTMNSLRNLYTTMLVAGFGAIVLTGRGSALPGSITQGPAAGAAAAAAAAHAFSYVFLAAALSLVVAFVAMLRMAERPLQTSLPEVDR